MDGVLEDIARISIELKRLEKDLRKRIDDIRVAIEELDHEIHSPKFGPGIPDGDD